MKRLKRLAALALLALYALLPAVAAAQSWPVKPVRILVGSTAGSSIDIPVRIVADKLKDRLGQPVVVENRPQVAGTMAVTDVAKSPAEGYVFAMGFNGSLANAPFLYTRLGYDPLKDITPIVKMGSAPFVLGVPASLGVSNVKEWVELVRKRPGQMNYSSLGNGSGTHLTMEMLKTREKLFLVHIPYVGGPAAAQAVATGEVQGAFMPAAVFVPHVKAGRVKLLAVTGTKRYSELADVPTMIESGVKEFESEAWSGIVGPPGMPREAVVRLNREINEIIRIPEVRDQLNKSQTPLEGGTPEQFAALLASEAKRWGPVIKYTGLRLD